MFFFRLRDPSTQIWHGASHILNLHKPTVYTLSYLELLHLQKTYTYLYPLVDFGNTVISPSSLKTSELSVAGEVLGSSISRNHRSSYVVAYWASNAGEISKFCDMGLSPRPGIIKHFLKHSLIFGDQHYEHWFAYCEWFLPVEEHMKNEYGKPVEVWYQKLFEQLGPASFIPVSRILAKFVHIKLRRHNKDLIILVPRLRNSCF